MSVSSRTAAILLDVDGTLVDSVHQHVLSVWDLLAPQRARDRLSHDPAVVLARLDEIGVRGHAS